MTDQPTNCIMLSALATEEVIRIDKEGFHYKGEFIADAGEAHRLMVEFLNQTTPQPKPVVPTDEEIAQFVAEWWENMHGFAPHGDKTVYTVFEFVAREHFADFTRDVLARWGTPVNDTREEN